MNTSLLAGLILAASLIAALAVADPVRVIDGDTIELNHERIRLWGIDAPEHDQPYGHTATITLQSFLDGKEIKCVYKSTDRYRRNVSICYANNADVGSYMVSRGLALDYTRYSHGHYRIEQETAQREKIGMWSGPFITPEEWRHHK